MSDGGWCSANQLCAGVRTHKTYLKRPYIIQTPALARSIQGSPEYVRLHTSPASIHCLLNPSSYPKTTMVSEINGSHPSQPQAWSHPVDAYLASNNIHYARATPLQGGYSAYVWRVDGYNDDPSPSPSSTASFSEPCVLKYADDAAKCVPGMALDPTRMRFEARALESEAVKSACAAEPGVQVPKVLRETERALLMTWGGEVSLKETLVEGGEIDGKKVGGRLGRWLACMHRAGVHDAEAREWESSSFMDPVKRNEYARLHEAMLANGFGEGGFHEVVERLEQPAGLETVTAWDFRPSNTLLRVEDYPEGEPGM